jgi:peptide/nickel transport system substrate-binding protein
MRLAFSFILIAAVSCAAVSARAATLRIGILADPATLDPAQSSSVTDRVVFAGFCDKLIDLDDKLHYVPQLATAWTWGADGLSLTLKLREGVIFQDGTPFDAEAVRFNLERDQTAPYSRRKTELKPVRAVTVVDSHTVRLDLSEPYVPLLAQLADRSGMMVSPKAARELGDKFGSHPVCAGPYRFVERVAQDRIVFDKFDQYWNKGAINIDRVVYLPIPDDTVRLTNLRAGGLQIIERVAPTDIPTVRNDARVRLSAAPSVGYRVLSINTNKGPAAKTSLGTSATLREAFELSLDRAAINQVAFDGAFVPNNQPEPPGSTFYDQALPVPPRDIARAKAIVAASGKSKVPVTLLVRHRPARWPCGRDHPGHGGRSGLRREDRGNREHEPARPAQKRQLRDGAPDLERATGPRRQHRDVGRVRRLHQLGVVLRSEARRYPQARTLGRGHERARRALCAGRRDLPRRTTLHLPLSPQMVLGPLRQARRLRAASRRDRPVDGIASAAVGNVRRSTRASIA